MERESKREREREERVILHTRHAHPSATQVIKAPPPPLPDVYSDETAALARWMLQKDPQRRPTLTQVHLTPSSLLAWV